MQSVILEKNHLWGSSFLQSIQKFMNISEMKKKIQKIFFNFYIIAFEFVAINTRFYWEKILVTCFQYVNKQSQDFRYNYDRIFGAQCLSKSSKNMIKLLICWFKQCLGPFNMLTVHKCSDMGLLSNPAFSSL